MPDNLEENEMKVLKQLHDGVIRPPEPMAARIGLSVKDVSKSLDTLSEKGLVEKRKKKKWKITYDGKAHLGILPGDVTQVEQALDRLSQAEKDDVQEIAGSQIQLLNSFYNLALDQAHRSFRWALIASVIGLLFFITAVAFVLGDNGSDATIVSAISGAIVEVIAGINFVLYGRTISQLSTLHSRLDITQRFLLANSLCESIEGDLKDKTRSELIARLTNLASTDKGGDGS